MLDHDDDQVIKECKEANAIFVTWDRVVRLAAGGVTPYEAMDAALENKDSTASDEDRAEVSRLRKLSPRELTVLSDRAKKSYEHFLQYIELDVACAKMIRQQRVEQNYSWRGVARFWSEACRGPWGSNQIAGMVICEKAAKLLGEDFMQPPWN